MSLREAVETYCRRYRLISAYDSLVIGVSGGPDSLCLLALLRQIAPDDHLRLHVAHLHHGLRGPDADADAEFVADLARQWGLPYTVEAQEVANIAARQRTNLEETARQTRYAFLVRVARRVGATKIAVAHNANDQAETVLMRFLRGAGVSGLAGMRPATPLVDFDDQLDNSDPTSLTLIRPLLQTPHSQIEAYCREHQITPRLDPTNADPTFLRNRIRHELLPLLETYNPNIVSSLLNLADRMAADEEVLRAALDQVWPAVVTLEKAEVLRFDLSVWRELPLALQRGFVRRAVEQLQGHLRNIEFNHIEQAVELLIKGRTGSQFDFPHHLRLSISYETGLLASTNYEPPLADWPHLSPGTHLNLTIPGLTPLPDGDWVIETRLLNRADVPDVVLQQTNRWQAYFDYDRVGSRPALRCREPGDSFAPFGLDGHQQRLKVFMIDQKIPAAQRPYIPLLVSEDGTIHWVCGWRTGHLARVTDVTERVLWVQFK